MFTLGVNDLQKAIEFYESGLGLPRMKFAGDIAFFTLNGSWLGLYPKHLLAEDAGVSDNGKGFPGFTFAHNVASKSEVDMIFHQALMAGAKKMKPPQDTFWGGYSGYFADPEGYLWEIAWNPHFWIGPEDPAVNQI